MNRTVRAVLFDLGNTLVSYYKPQEFERVLQESLSRICRFLAGRGMRVDGEDVLARARTLNTETPGHRVRPLQDRLSVLFGRGSEALSGAVLEEMCTLFLEPIFELGRLDPSALPTLRELRARGLKTAIVSNTPWGSPSLLWRAELERHGLSREVDAVVFCVDVGWRKPAPQVFEHALALVGATADESVFVGDHPRWDIEGAANAGIRPVLISPTALESRVMCDTIRTLPELLSVVGMAGGDRAV